MKVLDFGLAKAPKPAHSPGDVSQSPTITSPAMTRMGVILGTAAYMSPEQAKGRVADKRSDIWAFGCVLYEMLTGKRTFAGEDISETLAEVIKGAPDWNALPRETPPAVRRLLRRCLTRDQKGRISDAAVARLEIDEALAGVSEVGAQTAVGSAMERNRHALLTSAFLAGLLVGASVRIVVRQTTRIVAAPAVT